MYRLRYCIQEESESVSRVKCRCLRHLARDQFVCGKRNPVTRKKLLIEERSFKEALQVVNRGQGDPASTTTTILATSA